MVYSEGSGSGILVGRSVWPRWLMAVLVGVPAVGLGYYYLYGRRRQPKKTGEDTRDNTSLSIEEAPIVPHREQTPLERVLSLKNDGNSLFKKGKYEDAVKCYTEAISICPDEEKEHLSMLYQNRAATFECMNNMEKVLEDCSKALELNPKYLKALNRRYRTAERLGHLRQSLEDITSVCLLEKFENPSSLNHADRILKKLGTEIAKKEIENRPPIFPSKHFMRSYFKTYVRDPVASNLEEQFKDIPADAPLSGVMAAKRALLDERYEDVVQSCNEQLAMDTAAGDTLTTEHYQALLLRATMLILRAQTSSAIEDLDTIINEKPSDNALVTTALVKRATLRLNVGDMEKCLEDFSKAEAIDPNNPDIYQSRAQVFQLSDKLAEALSDFDQTVKYNPGLGLPVVQQVYTHYRLAVQNNQVEEVARITRAMRDAAQKYKDTAEAFLLLGQVETDQGNFEKADEAFKMGLVTDPNNTILIVHRGLLELQWKGDVEKAIGYLQKAIEIDDQCSLAFETWATIEVQRGNLLHSIELFDSALKLSHNENELVHIHTLKAAAEAQLVALKRLDLPNEMQMRL